MPDDIMQPEMMTDSPPAPEVEDPDLKSNEDNLAVGMSEEERAKLVRRVIEDYDADVLSRSGWDKRRANWLKLFSGQRDEKNFPWPKASNTHAPLLAVACLQFQARASEALLPPKGVMYGVPFDTASEDAADRVTRYMNWQLSHKMPEWEKGQDSTLLTVPRNGLVVKKTWYDPDKKRIMSMPLGVDEFVVPYGCKSLEDAPRKTHVIKNITKDKAKKRIRDKVWLDVELPEDFPTFDGITPTPEYQSQSDKTNDQSNSESKSDCLTVLEQHRWWDVDGDGFEEECIVTIEYTTQQLFRVVRPVYTNPVTLEQETMEFFTDYTFIPNDESVYGYGFGHFIERLNEAVTTILNQLIDAGTLANMQGGFKTKVVGNRQQNMAFQPGEWKEVEIYGDDIRKALFPLNYKEPSITLFNLLAKLQDYVREITTVSESMMGQLPPSDTKATTMLAVLEQGMKVFSSIHKRMHRSLEQELKKIFILNKLYLNDKEYFYVQDSGSKSFKTMTVPKSDFFLVYDVIPVSDPNIMSRSEKLIKAEHVLAEVRQNPITAQDPMAIYEATKAYYEALEVRNIDAILPKPEPKEPQDKHPVEENAGFIRGVDSPVLPQQNDFEHLRVHTEFEDTPYFNEITPDAKNLFDLHKRKHMAQMYQKDEMAAQMMLQQPQMAPVGPVPAQVEYPEMMGGESA